jgi:hypothetical protein
MRKLLQWRLFFAVSVVLLSLEDLMGAWKLRLAGEGGHPSATGYVEAFVPVAESDAPLQARIVDGQGAESG